MTAKKKSSSAASSSAAKRTNRSGATASVFSAEERAAMRDHANEVKAARRPRADGASEESAVLAKLAGMPAPDRAIGERLHAIISRVAPSLAPRLWYGMPAYSKDGKVLCFFQNGSKFKTRYSTLGFSDQATLDEGEMWPVAFALERLTPTEEAKITELLKKAVR